MSFTSPVFLLFLPLTAAVFWLCPKRVRWLPLLLASWFFYAYYNVWLLSLLLLTTVVTYGCGRAIAGAETQKQKRRAVALAAVCCLGLLLVFKYLDFALGGAFALARLFGAEVSFSGFHLLLPMGISFYVFQTLSYVLDVYRGKIAAERHFGYYALFVTFFPQLVAGPIERPGDLLPQLKDPKPLRSEDVFDALRLLLRGYAKKVLIADYLAPFVDAAYGNVPGAGGGALAVATVLFAVQIYCDFSGYSDIALGCARLMGVRLTENFRRPYAAVSVRDFWRRWHITLTRWFTDYLYIPLGGSRRGLFRQCVNTLIVFTVSGLWHGANVTFLCWGLLHGAYLVAETLLKPREPATRWGRAARQALTFLLVCLAWVFFRADTLADAVQVFAAMFTARPGAGLLADLGMSRTALAVTAALTALLPLLERLPSLCPAEGPQPRRADWSALLLYVLLTLAVVCCRCLVLTRGGASAFIYFQF